MRCVNCGHEIRFKDGRWYHYHKYQGLHVSCFKIIRGMNMCGCEVPNSEIKLKRSFDGEVME